MWGRASLACIAVGWLCSVPAAWAQSGAADFTRPKLVLNGQGHVGPLRSLIFSPDGKYLLSGGTDKVVHVWEFREGQPHLKWSLRPPVNRKAGWVYALACSALRDQDHAYRVAVAGYGASAPAGDIRVYRLPPLKDVETGDLVYSLSSGSRSDPPEQRSGHAGAVYGLDLSADGRFLASGSEDMTVRVWDLDASPPRTVALLTGHTGEVSRVAFLPGKRLLSAGGVGDGSLRIWDWPAGRLLAWTRPSDDDLKMPEGVRINTMSLNGARDQVVIGRENGKLERFDTVNLRDALLLNPQDLAELRSVEAAAFSSDGSTLATSILREKPSSEPVLTRTDCVVSVRPMPAGQPPREVLAASDRVRALAFHPSNPRFLAIGGGEAHAVMVHDLQAPAAQALVQRPGPGTVLWNVAFVDNKPTVAYARQRAVGQAPWSWEAFDLPARQFATVANPGALALARTSHEGWTIRTVPERPQEFPVTLIAVSPTGQQVPLRLNATEDRRWSSFSFIPPNAAAGHPGLTVAVGCLGGGVSFFSLPDGQKTRVFLGHAEAVYGLAPSADGRWLASCSADQTIRLWPLAGCDARPGLGAALAPHPQGGLAVGKVGLRCFAREMGLQEGDRIVRASQKLEAQSLDLPLDAVQAGLAAVEPGVTILLEVERNGQAVPLQTPRRDSPSLSLFIGSLREWIVWMPEGFYHSSIAGDRELLGWHVNRRVDPATTTDFFPMSRYAEQLRRQALIDQLLGTADPVAVLAQAQGPPRVAPPPRINPVAPARQPGAEIVAQNPSQTVRFDVIPGEADRRLRSVEVRNGSQRYPVHSFDPAVARADVQELITLRPNDNSISVVATDDRGTTAIEHLSIRLELPKPVPLARPRLVVRSIGVESFQGRGIPPIRYAAEDARRLAKFLKAPLEKSLFDENRISVEELSGSDVTSQRIARVFDDLAGEVRSRTLRAGDTVFLVLESHVVNLTPTKSLVLGADSQNIKPEPDPSVLSASISASLEEVASQGCLVVLLLDGLHDLYRLSHQSPIYLHDWIRDLTRRGVIVLLASKQAPSARADAFQLGAFARAVLDSVSVAGVGGAEPRASRSPTLDDFQSVVLRRVQELTGRRQFAGFYPPETLERDDRERIRIFEPQAPPVEEVAVRSPGPG